MAVKCFFLSFQADIENDLEIWTFTVKQVKYTDFWGLEVRIFKGRSRQQFQNLYFTL